MGFGHQFFWLDHGFCFFVLGVASAPGGGKGAEQLFFFEKKNFGLLRYFFNVLVVFLGWNLLDAPSCIVFSF